MKKILITIATLMLFAITIKSQVFINKSIPLTKQKQNSKTSNVQTSSIELDGLSSINSIEPIRINYLSQSELIKKTNQLRDKNPNSNTVALSIDTYIDINKSGKWDTLTNGDRIWRVNFLVSDINASILAFKELSLPFGTFMHIFDKNSDMSYGPLTFHTNSDGGGWMTNVLPFSNVVLEYVQPEGVLGTPKIVLNRVGQLISTNIDSLTNQQKYNTIQGRIPQAPYFDASDYDNETEGADSTVSAGSPVACNDTLEAYSRAAVQYLYLYDIDNSSDPFGYDVFDIKNGILLSTTDSTACNAYIATAAHVAWQDSSFLRDFTSFRFNWKRYKPDSTCCVYPKSTDWDTTINFSKIADYCGGIRKVFYPTNSQGSSGDFALIEMINYPIHEAYFSDWNANCFSDSVGKEITVLGHDRGKVPLMFMKDTISSFLCQSSSPLKSQSNIKLIPYECATSPTLLSGESGSSIMYKKNGIGLYDYEYIGTVSTRFTFVGLNWVYDIDVASNRPKTYLDPLNTGALANNGYEAYLPCQTTECCELIYSKLRPYRVVADANDSCCTNLIIEEKFPDDISCGDYTIIVRRAGTTDTLINELVAPANMRHPALYITELCEKLPSSFQNAAIFKYEIDFLKGDSTVLSCNREVEFICEKCDPDELEIELIPSKELECCYDIKIKELSNSACQFKYAFLKDTNNNYLDYKFSSPTSTMIGLNQDSLYLRNLCITESTYLYLYDESIGINAWGNPYVYDENRYIKKVLLEPDSVPCNCCENIMIEKGEECNEYVITQSNLQKYFNICTKIDSVNINIVTISGDLIEGNIHQEGGLSIDSVNTISFDTKFGGYGNKIHFELYDDEGNLICEKFATSCTDDDCKSIEIDVDEDSIDDSTPCCQTITLRNYSNSYNSLKANIREIDYSDPLNPVISSPLNGSLIDVQRNPRIVGYFEVCLNNTTNSFIVEYINGSDTICKDVITLECQTCCEDANLENAIFLKDTSSEDCCYNLELSDSCNTAIQYLKVVNLNDDITEYQGSISGLNSEEFCVDDNEPVEYKIEFFSDDDYADTNRLCIEEKLLNPCFESCCDSAYIESVRDSSINDPLRCCWSFNILNYNCDVYGVEIFDNYTYVNGYYEPTPDGYSNYYPGGERIDRHELGSSEFLPYYTEGSTTGDTTGGPINLDTMSQRIVQKICIYNDSHEQPDRSDPNAYISENIIIKLYGKDGEECTLETDLKCAATDICCDYVHLVTERVVDSLNPTDCCYKFGFRKEHWMPENCKDDLIFKEIYMYHDKFDSDSSKYLSDMYPIDSPEYSSYYINNKLDTLSTYYELLALTPKICQEAGSNPTDRMKIVLINSDGDTCTIDFYLEYCENIAALEYTTSFDNNHEIDVKDIDLIINREQSSLTIESDEVAIDKFNFDVYTLKGEKIYLDLINKNSIDISQLSSGLYYLVFKSDRQVIAKTFTIVR